LPHLPAVKGDIIVATVRTLGRLEPGDKPQRQRQLGLGGEGRVTAGEDHPEPVIVHRSHLW
jgi:hypothetical protein